VNRLGPKKSSNKSAVSRIGVKKRTSTTNPPGGAKKLSGIRSSLSKAKTKIGDLKHKAQRSSRERTKAKHEKALKNEEKRLIRLENEEKVLDRKLAVKAKKDKIAEAKEKELLKKLGKLKEEKKKWSKRLKALKF